MERDQEQAEFQAVKASLIAWDNGDDLYDEGAEKIMRALKDAVQKGPDVQSQMTDKVCLLHESRV